MPHSDSEIVIGLVCPVGIDHNAVVELLSNALEQFRYHAGPVRISDLFPGIFAQLNRPWSPPTTQSDQANYKIQAGNNIREWTGRADALALAAQPEKSPSAALDAIRSHGPPTLSSASSAPRKWPPFGRFTEPASFS